MMGKGELRPTVMSVLALKRRIYGRVLEGFGAYRPQTGLEAGMNAADYLPAARAAYFSATAHKSMKADPDAVLLAIIRAVIAESATTRKEWIP